VPFELAHILNERLDVSRDDLVQIVEALARLLLRLVPAEEEAFTDDPEDAEIVDQIKDLIETRVRPAVANDGGDIIYRGFDKGTVYLRMQGACAGCPSSSATLKNGIEQLLKHYVPEVTEVRAV
jgi:Fe-S cluster biogenesis protein NfuA